MTRYDSWKHCRNADGIPITNYGYQAGVYVGEQITIRMVATSAIGYYQQMKEGNSTAGIYFNNTINYIVEHRKDVVIPTENGTMTITVWPYDFAIWDLPKGWQSTMVDAMAMNSLVLAYNEYGNSSHLQIISQATNSFYVETRLGGNLLILDDGTHWYPETVIPNELYPDYPVPLVRNGFLFALYHMYEVNQYLNDSALQRAFDLGVISAAANLYKYDHLQYKWILYHLANPQKLAPVNYNRIHANLCHSLYEFTNVTIFDYYYQKWSTYTTKPLFTWEEIFS